MHRALLFVVAALFGGCGHYENTPPYVANDARFGRLAGDAPPPSKRALCTAWHSSIGVRDPSATSHTSFPEADPQAACFTRVEHRGRMVRVGPAPRGCAYPDAGARTSLETLARRLDEREPRATASLLYCALTDAQREASRRHDVIALRAIPEGRTFPYAAVLLPGHGKPEQDRTPLVDWSPGDACRDLSLDDLAKLGQMPARAARGADALRADAAAFAIVSGSAVHSRVVEAFALLHLLQCREGIAPSRILLEPCADHTHTNLRNGGRWIHAMGGRAAYLLTDDHIQSDYFQDSSIFDFVLGSIDQRSLRDFGYLIGAWRQASVGIDAGFWFTPYRFWAEPRDSLGSLTCVD